jgi:hypothetical protein
MGSPEDLELHVSRLAEMAITEAVIVHAGQPVGEIDLGRSSWFVVVGDDGEIEAAVPAAELEPLARRQPVRAALPGAHATVVAHPDCPVVSALASDAFRYAERPFAVVLRGESGVVGVWAGTDLADVLEFDTTRGGVDIGLSGDIHIPELIRYCAYHGGPDQRRCGARRVFVERPSSLEWCENPGGHDKHTFVW